MWTHTNEKTKRYPNITDRLKETQTQCIYPTKGSQTQHILRLKDMDSNIQISDDFLHQTKMYTVHCTDI